MNQQEATDFVIRELGKLRPRNDIIQKLCELSGMNWGQAEKFIRHVETQNKSSIAIKQSPLVTIMGIGMVLAGLAISIWIAVVTLQGVIIFFLSFPVPYLGNIFYFLLGIAMIAGGIGGMWDTLRRIWNS